MHEILENSLLIAGGIPKMFIDHENKWSSPVSDSVEIYDCDGENFKLPSLPRPLFGTSLAWNEGNIWINQIKL